jgi:hypothetical protein
MNFDAQGPRFQADMNAFNSVAADAAALRTKLNNGQLSAHALSTIGVPLGIYPGLADPATAKSVPAPASLQSHEHDC